MSVVGCNELTLKIFFDFNAFVTASSGLTEGNILMVFTFDFISEILPPKFENNKSFLKARDCN